MKLDLCIAGDGEPSAYLPDVQELGTRFWRGVYDQFGKQVGATDAASIMARVKGWYIAQINSGTKDTIDLSDCFMDRLRERAHRVIAEVCGLNDIDDACDAYVDHEPHVGFFRDRAGNRTHRPTPSQLVFVQMCAEQVQAAAETLDVAVSQDFWTFVNWPKGRYVESGACDRQMLLNTAMGEFGPLRITYYPADPFEFDIAERVAADLDAIYELVPWMGVRVFWQPRCNQASSRSRPLNPGPTAAFFAECFARPSCLGVTTWMNVNKRLEQANGTDPDYHVRYWSELLEPLYGEIAAGIVAGIERRGG